MCNITHHFIGKLIISLHIFCAIVLMILLVAQGVLAGQTLTVTNTNDSGSGSLRHAIESANLDYGLDVIVFNIPGSGSHTIQPLTPLPKITDTVIIDGYTQPGAALATDDAPATLLIELDGINVIGLHYDSGLMIHTHNSTVRGLVINRFGDVGINIDDRVGENIIEGNYIGTDVTGTFERSNFDGGVRIWDTPNNRIGGTTPAARNVISANQGSCVGILLSDATGNQILGNYIGTDATGTADLGNGNAVFIYEGASYNTIGPGNVISGNGGVGIEINGVDVTGNHILGNFIGTDTSGREALGNTAGVRIISCTDNILTDNTISNNGYGIQLESSSDNQIYNNNFINNTIQAYANTSRGGNIFNLEKPIGGNYWSDWTTPDADGDGFVDSPYGFTGGVDYLPWARQDGWMPPLTMSEALDTALSFTTGGDADWFSQTTTFDYDGDAAQSGDISHNQESWMQTTVSGAETVAFYWKVSSEEDFDFLEFYIDGSLEGQISGSVNWQQETYTISTLDSHTLEWRYVKDKGTDSGSDCGWIDKLEWVSTPTPPPLPLAFNPDPVDGAKYVSPNVELGWSSGSGAQLHIVYFGDNFDDVNNAPGGILQETTTYTPGTLDLNKVYYWRVDEFDGVVIHKGDVWSFTVADPLSEALD